MKLNWLTIAVVAVILLFWIGIVIKAHNYRQQKRPQVVSGNVPIHR
ncbi:MAG: hypothetical protein WAU58_13695 [Terriglobales bacterium]